jgi:hypothetical protein
VGGFPGAGWSQRKFPRQRRNRVPVSITNRAAFPPILRSEYTLCRAHKNTFPHNPRIPLLQVSTNRGLSGSSWLMVKQVPCLES